VYHANDWAALPFAARAAAAVGGRYVYDSHEYGVEQGLDRWRWRLVYPRYVRALEGRYIGGAAFVSTVGDGIAELLQRDYELGRQPLVIRNMPAYQSMPLRAAGEPMTVLYHGAFGTNRGLEDLVRSVSLWRSQFRLVVRGFGSRAYVEHLRRVAAESPAADRICFVEPVPMSALIPEANRADIGVHAIPGTSSQTRLSLPNKFFEYVMAGLAVCVTDLPEMGRLVRRHDLGRTIAGGGPAAIAAAINGFTRQSVTAYKANSLHAARELCWEHERDTLLQAYDCLAVDGSGRR
jgi:glycosyltransferase involved in cell wall biosynthesis